MEKFSKELLNDEIRDLSTTFSLREPGIRSAIKALQLPSGSTGLDAGCGVGLPSLLLAEAVGSSGHVTGIDLSLKSLKYAEEMVKQTRFKERVSFKEGDINKLPFNENTFDWVWSSDCVGYAPIEPLPLVKELRRVVKPGGIVAIIAWSSENLLPGHPILEARLNATVSGISPFEKGMKSESHFLRALSWFPLAGLENPVVRTFANGVHAPLSEDHRDSLMALFKIRWSALEKELVPEDLSDYRRLCLPNSPEFIVNQPDYYAFFTYSMFIGSVAE